MTFIPSSIGQPRCEFGTRLTDNREAARVSAMITGWVVDQPQPHGGRYSPETVRRILFRCSEHQLPFYSKLNVNAFTSRLGAVLDHAAASALREMLLFAACRHT